MRKHPLDLAALCGGFGFIPELSTARKNHKSQNPLWRNFFENSYNLVFVRFFYPQFGC